MIKVEGGIFLKDGGYLNTFVSKWFSNLSVHCHHLQGLLKFRLLGPT